MQNKESILINRTQMCECQMIMSCVHSLHAASFWPVEKKKQVTIHSLFIVVCWLCAAAADNNTSKIDGSLSNGYCKQQK